MEYPILILRRICTVISYVSKTSQTIGNYVLSRFDRLMGLSARELAERTATSPASVVRFCRDIGFTGYADFKAELEMELREYGISACEPGSTRQRVERTLRFHERAIEGMTTTLDEQTLEAACSLLLRSRRLLILGDGGSGVSARAAYDAFLQLRKDCSYVTDVYYQIMAIKNLDPGDAVLAFSNTGRSRNTIENVKLAKAQGVPTIGVIGIANTPIAEYIDIPIITNIYTNSFFSDSITAQLCEISAVSVLCMLYSRECGEGDFLVNDRLTEALDYKRVKPGGEL